MELCVRQAGDQLRQADESRDRVGKGAEDNGRCIGPQHQQAKGQHAGRYEEAGEGQQEQVCQDAEGRHRVERLHQDGQRAEIGRHACRDIRQQVATEALPPAWRRWVRFQDGGSRQQDGGHRGKRQPKAHVGEGPRIDEDDEHGRQHQGVAGVAAPFDAQGQQVAATISAARRVGTRQPTREQYNSTDGRLSMAARGVGRQPGSQARGRRLRTVRNSCRQPNSVAAAMKLTCSPETTSRCATPAVRKSVWTSAGSEPLWPSTMARKTALYGVGRRLDNSVRNFCRQRSKARARPKPSARRSRCSRSGFVTPPTA